MTLKRSSTGSVVPAVDWKETARADLLAIIDYISDDNPDAAQRLKDDIETKTSALASHPNMYRAGRVPGTREMVVHENYIVVYRVSSRAISILRVLHAAQAWPYHDS
jgi:toxin ParE1/3/4